jgi:autotransporter translocation and assembly factor TamB
MRGRRIARWVVAAMAWITATIVVLLGLAVAIIHSDWGRAQIRDRVVTALDQILAGQISIGRLEGSVLDRFSLHDVEVRDDKGELALRVDELVLDPDLWELIQQRVAVDVIILERLHVAARVRDDGSLNLSHIIEPQPEDEEVSPWIVSLDRVEVHDGVVTWTEVDGKTVTRVEKIDIETRVTTGAGDTAIELEHLTAYWTEGARKLAFHAVVGLHDSAVTAHSIDLRFGDARLIVPFAYHDWEQGSLVALAFLRAPEKLVNRLAPEIGLVSDAQLGLAALRLHSSWPAWVASMITAGGGSVQLYGAVVPEQPAATLHIDGSRIDLAAVMRDLPRTMLDVEARIDAHGDSLETLEAATQISLRGEVQEQPISRLALRAQMIDQRAEIHADLAIPAGTLAVDGAVVLGGKVPVIDGAHVRAALSSLDAATAAIPEFPGELAVGGEAEVDLRVSGPTNALAIRGKVNGSKLRWRDIQVAGLAADLDLRGVPGLIHGSASIAATDVMQVEEHYGDVEATVSTQAPGELDVAVRVSGRNALIPFFVSGRVHQSPGTTAIDLDRYELTTAHVTWSGRGGHVRIGDRTGVQARGVALGSHAGRVSVVDATVAGDQTSGTVSLEDIRLAEVSRVLERLTGAEPLPVVGTVSLRARLDKRGKRVDGDLSLAAADLAPAPHMRAATPAAVVVNTPTTAAETPATTLATPDSKVATAAEIASEAPTNEEVARTPPEATAARVPTADVNARVTLAGGALAVKLDARSEGVGAASFQASMRAPDDVTDARAWQAIDETALTALEFHLPALDLPALRAWAPEALAGVLAGKVSADVTVAARGDSARAQIALCGFRLASLEPAFDATVDLRMLERLLTVDSRLDAKARGKAELHAAARLPARLVDGAAWRALDERALRGAQLSVHGIDVDYWLGLAGFESDLDARGTITMAVREATDRIELNTRISVPAKPAINLPASTIEIQSQLARRQLDAELAVHIHGKPYLRGDAKFQAGLDHLLDGRAERFGIAPARIDLELADLPLALVGELLALPAPLGGTIRGEGHFTGSLDKPRIDVDLRGRDAAVADTRFHDLAIHGSYDGARIRLAVDSAQTRGGELGLDADIRLTGNAGRPWGTLALHAKQFDIGFIGYMLDEMEVDGVLDADLEIQGSTSAPVARGSLHLTGGVFHSGPPVRRIHDAEIQLEINDRRVLLKRATARSGGGSVSVRGSAELDGLTPRTFQARITSNSLPLELGATLITLDSDLRIVNGKHTPQGWTAETIVKRALVRLPKDQGRELHDVDAPEDVVFVDGRCMGPGPCAQTLVRDPEAEAAAEALAAPLALRLEVRARDTIEVRSEEARAILGANLVIDTRSGELQINGAVTVNNGHIELFGRRYQIQRAVASFDAVPGASPDPLLDVQLAHEFSTLTLFIQVQGTASKPELQLHSEPGIYDDATLLSFVLGAEPVDADAAQDTGGGPSVGDRAVGVASSLVVGQVQGLVQEVLPIDIDVFRVELGEASAAAERLIVGKWITDNLFLSYAHSFVADPNENSGEASLEYRFRKRWLIEGYYGDRGAGGLDLLWTKRF